MWGLDRLAAQATPASSPPPQQRPYSPAPRRSIHLSNQRPSLSHRSSSLSLASGSTNTAVPNSAKLPNGSGLKNQIVSEPPAEVEDPLVALNRLVGPLDEPAAEGGVREDLLRPPHQLDGPIDFGGLSLQAFADSRESTSADGGPSDKTISIAQGMYLQHACLASHTHMKRCSRSRSRQIRGTAPVHKGNVQKPITPVLSPNCCRIVTSCYTRWRPFLRNVERILAQFLPKSRHSKLGPQH